MLTKIEITRENYDKLVTNRSFIGILWNKNRTDKIPGRTTVIQSTKPNDYIGFDPRSPTVAYKWSKPSMSLYVKSVLDNLDEHKVYLFADAHTLYQWLLNKNL